jgi:hypothetical protein
MAFDKSVDEVIGKFINKQVILFISFSQIRIHDILHFQQTHKVYILFNNYNINLYRLIINIENILMVVKDFNFKLDLDLALARSTETTAVET